MSVVEWMEYWEDHMRGTFEDGYRKCCMDHDIIE